MLALESANVIGFVTALIGFMWCLGPIHDIRIEMEKETGVTSSQVYDPWRPQWHPLYLASTVAFVASASLTDGILVRFVENIPCYCLTGAP